MEASFSAVKVGYEILKKQSGQTGNFNNNKNYVLLVWQNGKHICLIINGCLSCTS